MDRADTACGIDTSHTQDTIEDDKIHTIFMERIVILGGGESGYGSAVLAKVKGFDVFLTDNGQIKPEYSSVLERYNIEYEQGGHTEERILSADLAVKSPGIPEKAPIVRKLHERGIPVISEIEFAGRYTKGRTICITGSNGKTTTTTLVGEILKAAGYNMAIGGNIGESFAYTVATDDKDWYVLELSSFQLDGIIAFRPDIAVLTNITPDHLDRYGYVFQNYINSKMRIMMNQRPGDCFIYGADSPVLEREVTAHHPVMDTLPFSAKSNAACGIAVNGGACLAPDNSFVASADGHSVTIDISRMKIKGIHNVCNAEAAALAALAAGVAPETIAETIYAFEGVEHRMEAAGTVNGVEYINDSKGTNVDSTWYALNSMTRPTIWIAGGTDKGNNYDDLRELAVKHVKALVCMGVDNSKLVNYFTGLVPAVYDTHSLDETMRICAEIAEQGDTVLLSPACASFDLFNNYEDRGHQFKAAVARMKEKTAK